jgi:hypothetical protein
MFKRKSGIIFSALACTLLLGSLAYAVSIDFKTYVAVSISELKTTQSDDGLTTETSIEFSGPGLAPFMALLPKASEFGKVMNDVRMLKITNFEQTGVAPDKATSIYLECRVAKKHDAPKCSIVIEKGVQPG